MKKLSLLLVLFLTLGCASHKYTPEQRANNNTFSINSNIDGVSLDFAFASKNNKNLGYVGKNGLTYTYKKLRFWKTFLVLSGDHVETKKIKIWRAPRPRALGKDALLGLFTYGAPLVIDPLVNADFYQVAWFNKDINVRMKYKQEFMLKQYKNIEKSENLDLFKKYLNEYPESNCKELANNKIDSLELKLAISKRDEKAMDDYISSHSSSKFLKEAQKIKKEYADARIAFEKAKQNTSSESMSKFINDFPNAIEYNEANKIFVDRAFKETLGKNTIKDALSFTDNILHTKKQFIDAANFENYKKQIQEAVDQLIVSNAEKDKSYETMKSFWTEYQDIQSKYYEKLGSFSKCFSLKNEIYSILYSNLLNKKTENEQTTFLNKATDDFKGLGKCDGSNPNESIVGCIIANANKPDGTIKLFNQQFLKKRYQWQGDLHYLLFYNDKDVSTWDVDYEELTFKENREVKLDAFKAKKPVLKAKFDNCDQGGRCAYEASFYNNGNLIRTQVSDKNEKMYYYDFENGVNISLKNLDNKLNDADRALALNDFDKALNILNNDCKNNYPGNVAQNQRLQNSIVKVKQAKDAYLKKQEEIRLAEERRQEALRLAEERKQEALRLAEEKKQEALRLAEEQRKAQELKDRYKPIVVDPVDFLDNRKAYIGKTLRFLVKYSNDNTSWPNTKEMVESSAGKYFDYSCRCMKQDPYKSVTYENRNYKSFELVEGNFVKISPNVPDEFFTNGKMNNSFREGYLVIDVYINSEYGSELIDIFRYKR
jgi:hypothetical protein